MDPGTTPTMRESPGAFGVANEVHVGFGVQTPFGPAHALTTFVLP